MAENDKYILQSVGNALDILDLLTEREEMSVAEVARATGLGKSTAFRLLATLEDRHFVHKDEAARYRLGVKLSSMGSMVLGRMEIVRYAHPHLVNLTHMTGESSHLVVWDSGTNVRFIDKVVSSSTIRMDSAVGLCRTAHVTGTGKVLLAHQCEGAIRDYMKAASFTALTPHSILTPSQLLAVLEQIRADGYGRDDEESEIGLTCFAAPILDMTGAAVAAISISGPTQRMNDRKESMVAYLKQTALDISNSLR